eukprot:XP_781846.1 PREDICTED: UPF0489 protein C5orf22 homolog [Strongylocentrotus purpuratus]
MSALRQYNKLPVWIVENHNEVLEPIYRAVATRHLPFEGIAMLHFDSHPDLQIDTDMPADTVFEKQDLLDALSIENWIMPAIYAGHIGHVTWVKPPWADQLPEGSRKVKVGRDSSSGKLRVNWPDSYFLSDLLFASEEELENSKDAIINVVTMETDCLRSSNFSTSPSVCEESRHKPASTVENDNHGVRKRVNIQDADIETQSRTFFESDRGSSNAGHDQNNVEPNGDTEKPDKLACSHSMTSRNQENIGLSPATEHSNSSTLQKKSCTTDNEQDVDGQRNCPTQKPYSGTEQRDCHDCADNGANLNNRDCEQVMKKDDSLQFSSGGDAPLHTFNSLKCNSSGCNSSVANLVSGDGTQQVQGSGAPSSVTNDAVVQKFSEFSGRFILDIDLDFFSTRNPFKQMYTKEQYGLMDELYRFAAPVDDSAQALGACQKRRAKQISELSAGLKASFNGEDYDASFGDQDSFLKIVELVRSLRSTPDIEPECLDPEMVHMAGLTCDDHGELPHHVSSDEEIDSLIATMRELLGKMPTPTMVTISRSSHDDYCPANQVDGIQRKTLKMLQSLYNQLDVHIEYELAQ